jgi:hypothetical protein
MTPLERKAVPRKQSLETPAPGFKERAAELPRGAD